MKALQWFNVVTLLIAATFAVLLGVVCLLYAVHLDAAPRMREEWPLLVRTTLVFWAVAACSAVAWFGVRRTARWAWPAQAAQVAALVGGGMVLLQTLG